MFEALMRLARREAGPKAHATSPISDTERDVLDGYEKTLTLRARHQGEPGCTLWIYKEADGNWIVQETYHSGHVRTHKYTAELDFVEVNELAPEPIEEAHLDGTTRRYTLEEVGFAELPIEDGPKQAEPQDGLAALVKGIGKPAPRTDPVSMACDLLTKADNERRGTDHVVARAAAILRQHLRVQK